MLELYQVPTSHSWQDTGAHKLSFSLAAAYVERKPRHIGWQDCTVLREDQIVSPEVNYGAPPKCLTLPRPLGNLSKTDLGTEDSESSSEQMQCFYGLRHARFYTEKNKVQNSLLLLQNYAKSTYKCDVKLNLAWGKSKYVTDLQFSFDLFHIFKSLTSKWCIFCVSSWGFTDLCCFCKQGNGIQ